MSGYKVWDFWADKYNRLWVQRYSLEPTRKAIAKCILDKCETQDGVKILDIGCGTGQLAGELGERGRKYKYLGIDVSKNMISQALKDNYKNAEFIVCDIEDFDYSNTDVSEFDIIVSSHSLPYFKNKPNILAKINKMLSSRGVFILVNASENNFYDKIIMKFVKLTTSKAEYLSRNMLLFLLKKNGFEIIRDEIIREKVFMPTICFITCAKGKEAIK